MDTIVSGIIEKLRSNEIHDQISGLESVKALNEQLMTESVKALLRSSNCYAISEKLFAMGPAVIPELERHIGAEGEQEALTYAAIILLRLGSHAGDGKLLQSLQKGIGPIGMIAQSLAVSGVQGASEIIVGVLSHWSFSKDPYTAMTLICSLRTLGAPIPEEIMEKLEAAAPKLRKLL